MKTNTHKTTINVPMHLYELLKLRNGESHIPINSIIVLALEEYFKNRGELDNGKQKD